MVFLRFAILGQVSLVTAALQEDVSVDLHNADEGRSDDGVSLLQYQARLNKHQTNGTLVENWAGGYMKCTEQEPLTESMCTTTGGGVGVASNPRDCAELAKEGGYDSFQFLASNSECILKQCDSVDMQWASSDSNWQVFSKRCGLQRSQVQIDGTCRPAITGNLIFPTPQQSVCHKGLKFKAVSVNNLRGVGPNFNDEGHMRVLETLPGVDLIIKADQNYVAWNSDRNGIHHGKFGRINLKSGTSTLLNFQFVNSGTTVPVKVDEFMFTVFDIDQFKGCYGRMSVTASHYSSYHVSDNTELIVKTDAGAPGKPASSTFMSSMAGTWRDNPRKPREMTALQKSRSVTFVFRNRKFFTLGVEVSDAGAGKNLLFGGRSSLLDELLCGVKGNIAR